MTEPGWRFFGAGAEGQRMELEGIDLWAHNWVEDPSKASVDVSDPRYGQRFTFRVYTACSGARAVRFAAGEFSNGVWGFYVPSTG